MKTISYCNILFKKGLTGKDNANDKYKKIELTELNLSSDSTKQIQRDPRLLFSVIKPKRNYHLDPLDLPVPRFKYDQWWVGPVPPKEVTFANLNDNIDNKFLEGMCVKFGELDECRIYYNPKTKKHLGLAKVVFQSQRAAKECCLHFDQTSKMGNVMSVFLDTMGLERSKMVDSLCNSIQPQNPIVHK